MAVEFILFQAHYLILQATVVRRSLGIHKIPCSTFHRSRNSHVQPPLARYGAMYARSCKYRAPYFADPMLVAYYSDFQVEESHGSPGTLSSSAGNSELSKWLYKRRETWEGGSAKSCSPLESNSMKDTKLGRGGGGAQVDVVRHASTCAPTPIAAEDALGQIKNDLSKPKVTHRLDYTPPHYTLSDIDLNIQLHSENTVVTSDMVVKFVGTESDKTRPLILDGNGLELKGVAINNIPLECGKHYRIEDTNLGTKLVIEPSAIPQNAPFNLQTEVLNSPALNTQLSGLYKSNNIFVTQCESEGFQRITYSLDRPDVMAKYKVRIEADKDECPVILSNGNMIESGVTEDNKTRHFAVWEDPFPKPSYLFAVVAGPLDCLKDTFTTMSGREISLVIYSEKENVKRLGWAMDSLKRAMKWDEETFGLEYDLDLFNIVAINDFNFGAMENKGLNIFNAAYLIADKDTATDRDYRIIEAVVAHEYFHNWSGNRVTCRDWFQLTLKEGLTVFRDHQFSRDMGNPVTERISKVVDLRARQFQEDAGPLAHPIRPESYMSVDNFYTATVYEKGAEVIRMYNTILGEEGFRKGIDLYFKRHDGQAVTCDDFRAAMADANGVDLSQFEQWYVQLGTPEVKVTDYLDPLSNEYTLTFEQDNPKQNSKLAELEGTACAPPLHIPIKLSVLNSDGDVIYGPTTVEMKDRTHKLTFKVEKTEKLSKPIPSLFQDFSAPVKVQHDYTLEELAFLVNNDPDAFNSWEAGQKLFTAAIFNTVKELQGGDNVDVRSRVVSANLNPATRILVDAFEKGILESKMDMGYKAYCLTPPSIAELGQAMDVFDVDTLKTAIERVEDAIVEQMGTKFFSTCMKLSQALENEPFKYTKVMAGRRAYRNTLLRWAFVMHRIDHFEMKFEIMSYAASQYLKANCLTDRIEALRCLCRVPDSPQTKQALEDFFTLANGNPLMVNKWFGVQSGTPSPGLHLRVKSLMEHPLFDWKNPNRVSSVVGAFAQCKEEFHAADGSGYKLVSDAIAHVDPINAHMGARLAKSFSDWRRFDVQRQSLIKAQLSRIKKTPGLSKETYEIVSHTLGDEG